MQRLFSEVLLQRRRLRLADPVNPNPHLLHLVSDHHAVRFFATLAPDNQATFAAQVLPTATGLSALKR